MFSGAPSQLTAQDKEFHRNAATLHHTASIPEGKFVYWEVEDVIGDLKKGKAPGLDQIHPEEIMLLDVHSREFILRLMNKCFLTREIPDSWRAARVASLYKKKGEDSDPKNYRPISLLSVLYKIYTRLLHKRISKTVDGRLRETQNGFRADHSASIPLHVVRRLQ